MSFILSSRKTFLSPVIAHVPVDGGKTQRVSFNVVFKALTKSQVEDLMKKLRPDADTAQNGSGVVANLTDRELLDELLVGFGEDLRDEHGNPMPFTHENVDLVCDQWPLEQAIVKSFFDNYIHAPRKN